MFTLKNGIQRFTGGACKVASSIALIAASFSMLATVVDWIYYFKIHGMMRECGAFVKAHVDKLEQFPSTETMDNWSHSHDLSPRLRVGAPGALDSMKILEGDLVKAGFRDFRIAYWDGDRFEFFNLWDETFTTSVKTHSGGAALVGLALFGIGSVFWFVRSRIQNGIKHDAWGNARTKSPATTIFAMNSRFLDSRVGAVVAAITSGDDCHNIVRHRNRERMVGLEVDGAIFPDVVGSFACYHQRL